MIVSPINRRSFGAAWFGGGIRVAAAAGLMLALAGAAPASAQAQKPPAPVGAPVKLAPPKAPPPLVPDDFANKGQAPSAGAPAQATPSTSAPSAPTALTAPPAAGSPGAGTSGGAPPSGSAGQPAQSPAAPPAESGPQMPPPTVVVDKLQAVDPDSMGVITEDAGGLGIGMWSGTPRALVERLLPDLPARTQSRTARDLTRRLLLSVATAPAGDAGKSLIALRAERLKAMADPQDMGALLDATATQPGNEDLTRLKVEAMMLSGQVGPACDKIATVIRDYPNAYWQKSLVFCQIVGGKKEEARLGLSLMRETDEGKDPAFAYMAHVLLGDKVKGDMPPVGADTVDLVMLRRLGKAVPASAAASDDPGVLVAVATAPDADSAVRMTAGERAEAEGALPADALGDLYASISFTPDELNNALSVADKEGGARARALLYQAIRQQQIPAARAEALRAALRLAQKDGKLPTMARVTLPLLLDIKPDAQLAWFAPDAARALLIGGKEDAALAWYDLVAGGHDPDSKNAELTLRPLVLLVRSESGAGDDALFQDWLEIMAKGPPADTAAASPSQDPAAQPGSTPAAGTPAAGTPSASPPPGGDPEAAGERQRKAALVLGLLDSLGVHLDAKDWDAFVTVDRASTAMPDLSLWSALRASARDARRGETVMLALIALGNGDLTNTDPIITDAAVSALQSVGLGDDARALAVEAAIAQGL